MAGNKKKIDPLADVQQEALLSMIDGDQEQEPIVFRNADQNLQPQDDSDGGEKVPQENKQKWIRTSIAIRSDVHEALHKIAFVTGSTANAMILEQINNLIAEHKDDIAFYDSLPAARQKAGQKAKRKKE